jgi:hypothetical protein
MTYRVTYALAWINAAIGVVAGVLAGAYLTVHPSWLTQDVAATCGILVPITVGLAALLPQVQRTPAQRDAKYLAALAGALPDDVANRAGLTVTRAGDTLNVSAPEVPPPA